MTMVLTRPVSSDEARSAADAGLASFWLPNFFGLDALTSLAVVGREVPEAGLGTAVVPIYTRHPFAMAQQALTVQAAAGGRLTLGIGLSHRPIVEGAWGLPFEKPATVMRDYLSELATLIGRRDADVAPPAVPDRPTVAVTSELTQERPSCWPKSSRRADA